MATFMARSFKNHPRKALHARWCNKGGFTTNHMSAAQSQHRSAHFVARLHGLPLRKGPPGAIAPPVAGAAWRTLGSVRPSHTQAAVMPSVDHKASSPRQSQCAGTLASWRNERPPLPAPPGGHRKGHLAMVSATTATILSSAHGGDGVLDGRKNGGRVPCGRRYFGRNFGLNSLSRFASRPSCVNGRAFHAQAGGFRNVDKLEEGTRRSKGQGHGHDSPDGEAAAVQHVQVEPDAKEASPDEPSSPKTASEHVASARDEAFYDDMAEQRKYFYFIDLQGRLFLEQVQPKQRTIATCLKSEKFLRFFWRQLRPNDGKEFPEYPWISPCGKEMNFIQVADKPVVFETLSSDAKTLKYAGGSLEFPFDPSKLSVSETLGRLYHPIETKRVSGMALIRSHLALDLSQHIRYEEDPDSECPQSVFHWEGQDYTMEVME